MISYHRIYCRIEKKMLLNRFLCLSYIYYTDIQAFLVSQKSVLTLSKTVSCKNIKVTQVTVSFCAAVGENTPSCAQKAFNMYLLYFSISWSRSTHCTAWSEMYLNLFFINLKKKIRALEWCNVVSPRNCETPMKGNNTA